MQRVISHVVQRISTHRVCQTLPHEALVAQGAPVVSVSRSGSPPEGAGASLTQKQHQCREHGQSTH